VYFLKQTKKLRKDFRVKEENQDKILKYIEGDDVTVNE